VLCSIALMFQNSAVILSCMIDQSIYTYLYLPDLCFVLHETALMKFVFVWRYCNDYFIILFRTVLSLNK